MSANTYRRELTDRIIAQLEAGTAPWVKPWNPAAALPGTPHNAVTGREYRGGNRLWLSCQEYSDPRWCTYRQAQEQGWQVRRQERATTVEYWQWSERQRDAQGQLIEVPLEQPRVYFARLFNAAQLDGIGPAPAIPLAWQPEAAAEHILQACGVEIRYDKTDSAFYSPTQNVVHSPPRFQYPDAKSFYSVLLHEISHASGHPSRLNRDLSNPYGSPGYALEELNAELGCFFLASKLGIPHDPGQHASYIASWVEVLRNDHHQIFRAAKEAERITEYILGFAQELTHTQNLAPEHPASKARQQERELEC